ncbi:MAG: hypothetical protein LBF58_03450 [Deltaproteobacteria bacterium]|nr:hypothetical protein [Deltaproteobacteria bacterium]
MKPSSGLTKTQNQVIGELDKLAKKNGLKVSGGKLVYAGLRLRGGNCVLRRENWLVVDRLQPYEDQLDAYRRALSGFGLMQGQLEGLSPQAREALARGAGI